MKAAKPGARAICSFCIYFYICRDLWLAKNIENRSRMGHKWDTEQGQGISLDAERTGSVADCAEQLENHS